MSSIVLAAGKSKRMGGTFPKALLEIAGKPMIDYVIESLRTIKSPPIVVVVGFKGELVKEHLGNDDILFVEQKRLIGTADAVRCALPFVSDSDEAFVLCADAPFVPSEALIGMRELMRKRNLGAVVLTVRVPDPTGYGRIVRDDDGFVERIVEEKDTSPMQQKIDEINTGAYIFEPAMLRRYIPHIQNDNAQGEYYLTDVVALMRRNGKQVGAYLWDGDYRLCLGVNRPDDYKFLKDYISKGE